jgi:hypothetical protein
MNTFLHVSKFINEDTINYYLKQSLTYPIHDSKVGNRIGKDKKIRKDVFFSKSHSELLDSILFNSKYDTFKHHFNIDIQYRETYKLGTYYAEDNGFYTSHTDTQGGMDHRKLSIVICLSNECDYRGGLFKFIDLDKSFKFDKGDAVIFDSKLLHCVEPVTYGKRQVLVSFIWDEQGECIRLLKSKTPSINYTPYNNHSVSSVNKHVFKSTISEDIKYISLVPADSGPGNQIIGIKECLLLSLLLNRTCIIPPIREHYLKSNTTFYHFNDIFNLNIGGIIIDDETCRVLNNENIQTMYTIYPSVNDKKLRHEQLFSINYSNVLLSNRKIQSGHSLDELKHVQDNILVIRHLFNNVSISSCGMNGCFTCPLNPNFSDSYKYICSHFDYSCAIKSIGDTFINDVLNNHYIAIHIRLPDVFGHNSLDDLTNRHYDSNRLFNIISHIKEKFNKPVFIASNNINYLKNLNIDFICYTDKHKYSSFIDQYICCKSDIFFYLNLNSSFCNNIHNRSTYASFIIDYRLYLDNRSLETNINLHHL